MKRTQEDEPPKARRGWKRDRARPPQNGDGGPPAAKPKRSSRSVFGPSGEDRPDVLTDAETVVLPVWLHHRQGSADGNGKSAESAASRLKRLSAPAQEDEATRTGPEPRNSPATWETPTPDATPEAKAEVEAEAASGASDAGEVKGEEEGVPTQDAPAEGDHGEADWGDAGGGPDEGKPAQPGADAAPGVLLEAATEADTRAAARAEADSAPTAGTEADADTVIGTIPRPPIRTSTDADADTLIGAVPRTAAEAEPRTAAGPAPAGGDAAGPPGAGVTGPDAATPRAGTRPDAEVTTKFSLADLETARAGANGVQAKTVEAIDELEARTLVGLEARTAKALETVTAIEAIEAKTAAAIQSIEAMTAEALQAIDATVAEMAPEAAETTEATGTTEAREAVETTGKPGQAEQAESAGPDRGDTVQPDRAESAPPDEDEDEADADSSPGTEVVQTRVISIDEPPASVTLTTSSTETTIAVPQPRAESLVAVAPVPAVTPTLTPVPERARSGKPAALPPAGPPPDPQAKQAYTTTQRRTRVSRALLLCILCLQALLSLRLHNTAFEDEALYVYSGHMELQHLLHGAALQGQYASYFSGSPVLYPVAAGFLNGLGGLTAARMLSLAEMLSITTLLYSMTRRLFNERIALCAAMLFSVCESAIFLGNFATYDATCLFLLACAAWITVRTASFRWPVFLMAAPVAALAVGVKYAGLLFVPTIAVLPAVAGWPLRGRRVLLYPPVFVAGVAGLLYGALHLGGRAYMTAISSTTTQRAQGVTPVITLLREAAEWGGVIFVLAVIGTAAYLRRIRTEPEELIAPAGGRFRRLCLGLLLTGTALLAPAYQAHLHTDISFQKHIGFGLFFAAPIAGLGLARLLGDHFRRPHIAVGIWSLALILGLVQTTHLYQVWPTSNQFVKTFSHYLKPHARYLVEVPEVPIYYLLGHADAQPRQFTSTFYINYVNSKSVILNGTVGFTAAVNAGYFQVVAYNNEVTAAADAVLAQALSASKDYYLAAEIHITDVFGPGDYFIWVKGHQPAPSGVFNHTSNKYLDLGTKSRELAP